MQRWALGVEYNGACFAGFQRQPHCAQASVQGALEAALSRIADEEIRLVCAGRTDAGVHATAQVVSFDTTARRDARAWVGGGNALTPSGLCIQWARPMPPSFHARFSACARSYLYVLSEQMPEPALLRDRLMTVPKPLDAERLRRAAAWLVGEQDFTSFRAAGCQARHAVREVERVAVYRSGSLLGFEIRANAFLQHMVRNIVGSLILVATGEQEPGWIGALLAARDRTLAGPAVSAAGLYLVDVTYPQYLELPKAPAVMPWCLVRGA